MAQGTLLPNHAEVNEVGYTTLLYKRWAHVLCESRKLHLQHLSASFEAALNTGEKGVALSSSSATKLSC